MKYALSLLAVAGIAAGANAAQTNMRWEVSVNGGAFSFAPGITADPGATLTYRLRVALQTSGGTGPAVTGSGGLAGFNFLPALAGLDGGDSAVALGAEQFPEGSAGNPFPGVINHPDAGGPITNVYTGVVPAPAGTFKGPGNLAGNGRTAPWGANGTNTNGVATSSVVAGVLTWRAGVISNAGVSLSQLNQNNSQISAITGYDDGGTPGDNSDDALVVESIGGFYNAVRNGVFAFQYSVVLGASAVRTSYELVQTSAILTPAQWFINGSGGSISHDPALGHVVVSPVTVTVTPAPGALALLGLGGLVAGRRRRN